MATAKKLPSGSWRVQKFSHYEMVDGRKVARYKSFTSKDRSRRGKAEAERMADEWSLKKDREASVTVYEAVSSYLKVKEAVLSPSTLRAYKSILKNHFGKLGVVPLASLRSEDAQKWIGELTAGRTPKTVRNIAMLLSAAYRMYTDDVLRLHLPQSKRPELHTPTDAEVKKLIEHVKGEDLEIAIALSAYCSLRRGEVCALTRDDFRDGMVHVNKSIVKSPDGDWVVKQPKTSASYRVVPVPDGIMRMVERKEDRIIGYDPNELTRRFEAAVKRCGLCFRFHDLRHYYASTAHYLGVPDAFTMASGGWATESVMKRVYREALEDKRKAENDKIAAHYNMIYHTEADER